MNITTKLFVALGVLALISPLGLLIPGYFKSGSAWGEWGSDEIAKILGYVPQGLEKLSSLWQAPLPDYAFKGWEGKGLLHLSFAYIFSAVLGIVATVSLVILLGKLLTKKTKINNACETTSSSKKHY